MYGQAAFGLEGQRKAIDFAGWVVRESGLDRRDTAAQG
jgi:hypothetical protein